MSLELDTRQRAMLLEMGVRVWQPVAPVAAPEVHPQTASAGVPDSAAQAATDASPTRSDRMVVPAQPAEPEAAASRAQPANRGASPHAAAQPATRPAGPTRLTELADGIEGMDWHDLTEAVRHCQACAMCLGRRAPVLAAPTAATPCDWLVVADPPDEAQERSGLPFVEDAGQLLDNMLRAVGVQRWDRATSAGQSASSRAYLTHVLKCRPALMRAPDAAELATCAHFLRREITLTQPRVIVAMGRFAMQLLLSETPPEQARLPLGKLRGQVWRFADVPVVVTYPPVYLLRNGQHKAQAWADLCLARAVASGAIQSDVPSVSG